MDGGRCLTLSESSATLPTGCLPLNLLDPVPVPVVRVRGTSDGTSSTTSTGIVGCTGRLPRLPTNGGEVTNEVGRAEVDGCPLNV